MFPMPLAFPLALWSLVESQLTRALPEEACGLLAGHGGLVEQVYPVDNALHSPTAYRMDAAGQVRAMLAIEQAKLALLGIYHSHPVGPAIPSATDLRQASYPDALYLICSPAPGRAWQARAFWLRDGVADEEPLVWTR